MYHRLNWRYAAARHQCSRAVLPKYLAQPKHLATAKPHQRHCLRNPDPLLCQIAQNVHPIDLRTAHQNHRHRPPAPHPIRKPGRVTSLSGPTVTSLSGVYSRHSRNERLWNVRRDHSGLMPANLTTLVHFSASAATKAPNSAALRLIGMVPTSLSRALMSAVASPALISRLSRLMISTGVPAGAQTPPQVLASYPGSVSAMVGTSGSMSNRWLPATASARRPPERMCGSDVTITSKATCTYPPTRSVTIGAPPR